LRLVTEALPENAAAAGAEPGTTVPAAYAAAGVVLLAQHARLLAASAIAAEVAAARGYRSVTEKKVLARCGFSAVQQRVPALLIPVWDVCGEVALYQARPDDPRVKDGKTIKYETRRGAQMVVDVPPRVRSQLGDPRTPLLVTEGVRKADSAVSVGLCCVALLGVWNWRGTNEHGGQSALADWEQVALKGRTVYVVFDSDATTNPGVYEALARLKGFLERRGAAVQVVYLPCGPEGGKVGLDDFLAAGHEVEELLSLASAELRVPPGVGRSSPYEQGPGGIVWNKLTGDGPSRVLLTNFSARIVGDVVEDDAQETRRVFELEAELEGKVTRFSVEAASFGSLSWVPAQLGPRAIVMPGFGLKDHARAAIQYSSQGIAEHIRYTHTGWRPLEGGWAYLHAGGAIGATGPVHGVEVVLPEVLSAMQLPAPASLDDQARAIRASLDLLELAQDRITMPSLASVYRACLVECDYSIHLAGPTGAGKSELAALVQQHYGAGFDARNLPASWSGTDNALEALAFTARHAVFVIDDFTPAGSQADVNRLHGKADRVLRGQGNRSGRQRMRADTTLRPVKRPRGLIVSTGEDIPRGQSLRARLLVLELGPGDLDFKLLSQAQADAAAGLYAKAMAGYIAWVAPRYEQVRADLRSRVIQLRAEMARRAPHRRTSEIAANLQFGLELFLDYALEAGAISQAQHQELRARCGAALDEVIGAQARHQQASDPARRFCELLSSAISAGHAHLAHPNGTQPDTPEAWGWRKHRIGTGAFTEYEWLPQGKRVGWIDGDDVYLDTLAACEAAYSLGQRSGDPLTITPTTLRKRLHEQGLLKSTHPKRETLTIRRQLEGKRREVINLAADSLEKPDHNTEQEPDHTPPEHADIGFEPHDQPRWSTPTFPDHTNPTSPNPSNQAVSDPDGRVGRVIPTLDTTAVPNAPEQQALSFDDFSSSNNCTRPQNPTTPPRPGDPDYRSFLNRVHAAGQLTDRERHELRLVDDRVRHAQPPAGEKRILAEIDELIEEGVVSEQGGHEGIARSPADGEDMS
jgi:hypothetical protein